MKHVPKQSAAEAVEVGAAGTAEDAVAMAVAAVGAAAMVAVAGAAEIAATAAIAGKHNLSSSSCGVPVSAGRRVTFLRNSAGHLCVNCVLLCFTDRLKVTSGEDDLPFCPRVDSRNKLPRNVFETTGKENTLPAELCSI
jgi:hypothetical protein